MLLWIFSIVHMTKVYKLQNKKPPSTIEIERAGWHHSQWICQRNTSRISQHSPLGTPEAKSLEPKTFIKIRDYHNDSCVIMSGKSFLRCLAHLCSEHLLSYYGAMLHSAFVCVDTETTGLIPLRDRIIEIGLLRIEGGEVTARFQTLLQPDVMLPAIITEITGITDDDLVTAPRFRDVAEQIASLLDGALFVAHNAEFDYRFLKHEFTRVGIELSLSRLCTVRLSRMLYPEHRRHDLSSIIERYNFPIENRHRAFDDALIVWQLLERMKSDLPHEDITRAVERLRVV